jgi:hypothetical protein
LCAWDSICERIDFFLCAFPFDGIKNFLFYLLTNDCHLAPVHGQDLIGVQLIPSLGYLSYSRMTKCFLLFDPSHCVQIDSVWNVSVRSCGFSYNHISCLYTYCFPSDLFVTILRNWVQILLISSWSILCPVVTNQFSDGS